jgi:hypothetical protein
VVVDCESGPVRLGLAGRLATALGARHLRLDQVSAEALHWAARGASGCADPHGRSGVAALARGGPAPNVHQTAAPAVPPRRTATATGRAA